jgi:cytochrome c oxidase subunit 4
MAGKNDHAQHSEHHVIPFELLVKVAVGLLVLTVLTVITAKFIHLGALGPIVAFAIAGGKAYLVMAYFMGLKYDSKGNALIFLSGFAFLALLFFFCALDIWTRVGQTSTL